MLKKKSIAPATLDIWAEVETIRSRIISLAEQRGNVAGSPVPAEAAQAKIGRWLDEIEAKVSFSVSAFCDPNAQGPEVTAQNALAIAMWLLLIGNREAIAAALGDAVSDHLEAREPLNDSERRDRLVALDDAIDDAERAEERLIRQGEAAAVAILRRPEARPSIVLMPDSDL